MQQNIFLCVLMSPETSKLHPLLTISGGYKQELLQAKELYEHVCRLLSVLVVYRSYAESASSIMHLVAEPGSG